MRPKPGAVSRAQAFRMRVQNVSDLAPAPAGYEYISHDPTFCVRIVIPQVATEGCSNGFRSYILYIFMLYTVFITGSHCVGNPW